MIAYEEPLRFVLALLPVVAGYPRFVFVIILLPEYWHRIVGHQARPLLGGPITSTGSVVVDSGMAGRRDLIVVYLVVATFLFAVALPLAILVPLPVLVVIPLATFAVYFVRVMMLLLMFVAFLVLVVLHLAMFAVYFLRVVPHLVVVEQVL